MKVVESDSGTALDVDHPHARIAQVLLMEALGTSDHDFMVGLLQQLANAGTEGQKLDASGLNFMLSVVEGAKPADQFEAMLAAQMAVVHMATMTFARRLAKVDSIPQQDSVRHVGPPHVLRQDVSQRPKAPMPKNGRKANTKNPAI
jgi:hypothetical protein